MFNNLPALVEYRVARHPQRIALVHGEIELTYAQLNERANRLAHYLLSRLGGQGKTVGICLERSPDLMIAILATLKAGLAYVPFDSEYPAERLAYMAEQSGIQLMLSSTALQARLPKGNYEFLDVQHLSEAVSTSNPALDIDAKQAAYILFTSGSTGQPKGVQLSHAALLNLIDWQLQSTSVHDKGRTLQFAPVSFDVHFQEIFSTWADGGCLVLIDDEARLNTDLLLKTLVKQKINRLYLPFVALQNLCEQARHQSLELSALLEIITAGEQLQVTPALVDFFERIPTCRLFNHYGPTETHVVTSFLLEGPPATWPALPPIGQPIPQVELYLLGEDGLPVQDGDEGELFVAGPCLADGYVKQEKLTTERFVANPFLPGQRMYRTGDLAKRLSDGNIQYLGRKDGQFKVRGYRIELGEVELALAAYPGISLCAASVREERAGEKKLIAYVVMSPGKIFHHNEVRRFLTARLPAYMQPAAFVELEALPLTPSGKVNRQVLPAPGRNRPALDVPFVVPDSSLERQLAEIWSEVLDIHPIGAQDNFFDLGGNSLLALQSVALLKARYGITLSVTHLYAQPHIAGLVAHLSGAEAGLVMRDMRRFISTGDAANEGIAVIGMSLRFPGATTVEQFWENLCQGVESVTFFKPEELDPALPADLVNDPNYVAARGVIADAEGFDAAFFGCSPNVALVTDPQQRVALELAWNALEHAGYAPDRYTGLIGVFAGVGNNSYYQNNVLPNPAAVERVGSFLAMTQNEKDYIATRIAYELDLKGLAVSVHSGCSTSLVAIAQACEALRSGQCDMVLAGGAAITAPVNSGQLYEEGAMFSNDGHTRSFDAAAQGTVFSDGAGFVVLKRHADAVHDGDQVYAIVKGHALNNDGGGKSSFTAPSVLGQAAVIQMAQAMAGFAPDSISYIEAHGTATPLGDPVEIEGLSRAFRAHTAAKQFCAIGSVKTNIGHLTAAAGVAGFIKTVLALHNKAIPASLGYQTANPQIDFGQSPFFVNAQHRAWNSELLPRRAGVSSFGVGGTNAHVVLEEAPNQQQGGMGRSRQLLQLSARTETALAMRRQEMAAYLEANPAQSLADVAYTLQTGRHDFAQRWFATAHSTADAIALLNDPDSARSGQRQVTHQATGVVFMFPGQGAQYCGMGSVLYRDDPIFRAAVDRCNALFEPLLGEDLRKVMFATVSEPEVAAKLKQTFYTQPALFTLGYSLAQRWLSWGVQPVALIGHSIGEFVAATLAGVFTLEEGVGLVATRCRLMQDCPPGGMLSVRLPEAQILPRLNDKLAIAAVNGPQLCVVAGPYDELERLEQDWTAEGVVCKALQTSHAFHSPMMDPVVAPFSEAVRQVTLSAPHIPILSTVSTDWLSAAEATDPRYWAGHLRATVRFAAGVKALWSAQPQVLMLELGPRNTASILARQQASDPKNQKAIPSLGDGMVLEDEWTYLLSAVGQLWLSGVSVEPAAFFADAARRKCALPGYPFEHKRYWLAAPGKQRLAQVCVQEHDVPQEQFTVLDNLEMTAMTDRKETLIHEIIELLEDASGMSLSEADRDAALVEIGLDSLLLTQVALSLTKKYGIKVTFRQLNVSLSTLNRLAEHFDKALPVEAARPTARMAVAQAPMPAQPTMAPAATSVSNDGSLQWLIAQQMQIMQQQLAAISAQAVVPASVVTPNLPAIRPVVATKTPEPVVNEVEMQELKKPFGAIARIEKTQQGLFSAIQQVWLDHFIAAYNVRTAKSKAYTQQHRPHLADPRVVNGFRPHLKEIIYQPVVNRSMGAKVWDIDGNEYVDILNGFGSNMFGHNPPFIVAALAEQLQRGYELGPQHELAGEVTQLICEMTGFDRAGLCNTGSEAVMGAIRIARTVTGRSRIISFNGSYHGINDEVIVRGSKKLKSIPAAAGINPSAVENILVIDYGTAESLEIIRQQASEVAAILVEPVQSRRADFQPKEFLQQVRKITEANNCLLIFDEVITGFRTAPGGAQDFYGIRADLGTYGKVVGGGMPIGVIAGKREYMDALDGGFWQFGDDSVPEVGVTYFAGTFVRHPFALAAAKASLLHMKAGGPALQEKLNSNTFWLADEINDFCSARRIPFQIVHFGSLFKPKYEASLSNIDLLFFWLRQNGVHVYDGFPCFLTEAHTTGDIEFVVRMFKAGLQELVDHGFIPGQTSAVEQLTGSPSAIVLIPTTAAQREIFTSIQIGGDPANCAYNESVTLRLHGEVDEAAMQKALEVVLARHDALRACFSTDGTEFYCKDKVVLPWHHSTASSPEEGRQLLLKLAREEVLQPFDLSEGPLIRLHFVKLAKQEYALLLTAHHIVCDGWSLSLVIRDLSRAYSSFSQNHEALLPLAPSFANFAQEQLIYQASEEQLAVEAYWRKQFEGELPVLEFPPDRSRPAERSFYARRVDVPVPEEVLAGLHQLAKQTQSSFVTLMLSAFEVFLYRITGQRDVVVGLPTAGQSVEGSYELVGHCVNLLPLRTQIQPQQSFADYLRLRRDQLLDAYDHQKFTFGSLLQKLNIHRGASRIPLVPVVFNVDIGFTEGFDFSGCTFDIETNERFFENFEIFLNATGNGQDLTLECTFNNDLFNREMMRLRMEEFVTLLGDIVNCPTTAIANLEMIPAKEKNYLSLVNETAVPFASPFGIHECILKRLKLLPPGHPAVVSRGITLSYMELIEKATYCATQLQSRGVGPGMLVGISLQRSAELPAVLLGILMTGAAYLPLDPGFPPDRLHYMLQDASASLVITTVDLQEKLQFPATKVLQIEDVLTPVASCFTPYPIEQDTLAYVLYTSGSTGKPKGIAVRHAAVTNLLKDLAPNMGMDQTKSFLAVTTISFDISVLELFMPLMYGATVHIASKDESMDPFWITDYVEKNSIDFMQATPATYNMMFAAGWRTAKNLSVLCGGEGLRVELAEQLFSSCREVWNLYGPTETTIWSTVEQISTTAPMRMRSGLCSIGRPVANTRVFVVDENGKPCPFGVPGELWIGGEGLSAGYLNLPDLNREKFVTAPDGQGLVFRTGDSVQMDREGYLYYLNRFDHQVKIRGYRIELSEIETVLDSCDEVRQAVVMSVQDQSGQQALAAWIVPTNTDIADGILFAACRQALAKQLPDYMMPTSWLRLAHFPLTPNGKINRRALPSPYHLPAGMRSEVLNTTQEMMLQVWRQVLGVEQIGLDDNFFDLGGHSLLAVKLMVLLEHKTNQKLPIAVLFSSSTIRELSTRYETAQDQTVWEPIVPLRTTGEKAPIYFAHGISGNVFKYHALALMLPEDQPCYGLQAFGLNGHDEPFKTIKHMAAYHVAAIRKMQPKGPYHLVGGSFGGYLAYEMAFQLKAVGEDVGLLCLCDIEACRIQDFLPSGAKQIVDAAFFSTRFIKRAFELVRASKEERAAYFEKRKERSEGKIYDSWLDKHKMAELIGHESTACFQQIEEACYNALMSYQIPVFDGDVLLVRANQGNFSSEYAYDLGWSNYIKGRVEVMSVPGDHNSIFWEPHIEVLARALTLAMEKRLS